MPKPSEYLKACGWIPEKSDCQPRETYWIDPLLGQRCTFIEAVMTQGQRDLKAETIGKEA